MSSQSPQERRNEDEPTFTYINVWLGEEDDNLIHELVEYLDRLVVSFSLTMLRPQERIQLNFISDLGQG